MIQDKKGSFVSIMIMIVTVFIVVLVSVVMIYAVTQTQSALNDAFADIDPNLFGSDTNVTQVIDNTVGEVGEAYSNLQWISVMLIFGMVMGMIYGSYKVRTKPVFFIPYFIMILIAIIVAVGISNAWETLIANETLTSTFALFTGANHFMLWLPVYATIIGILGGIIMFISWSTAPEDQGYYYYYGQ